MGGGEMIREVKLRHSTFNEVPYRFEAGTPDVSAAIGLGAALDYLTDVGLEHVRAHEKDLVDYALAILPERVPTIRIHGPHTSDDRAGIITFNLADAHPHDVATLLDREAIAIRAGPDCTMPAPPAPRRRRQRPRELLHLHRPRRHRPPGRCAQQGRETIRPPQLANN